MICLQQTPEGLIHIKVAPTMNVKPLTVDTQLAAPLQSRVAFYL